MKDNVKRVFYVRYVAHPCYLEIIAQRPEIRLDKLENDSADGVAGAIMAGAPAHQTGSGRDQLHPRPPPQRALLAPPPHPPPLFSPRARFLSLNAHHSPPP